MSHQSSSWIRSKAPQLSLLFMTLIWGGTFIVVQYALNYSTPMFFVGCRFAAAAFAVSLLYWRELRGITAQDCFAGLLIGAAIAGGYGMQTVGLQTISSSESAFLTALYVPLVPILLWIIFRKAPHIMTWIGVVMAFVGLLLLTGNRLHQLHFNFGQLITIIGSISIALEIIFIGYFSKRINLARVTVLQLVFASLISFISMPFIGELAIPAFSWPLLFVAVGLGCASAFIQLVMNWAQRFVDPTQAAIIYAAEPVWAGIIGRLAGERLAMSALGGGMLVVLAVIISQINPRLLVEKFKKTAKGL